MKLQILEHLKAHRGEYLSGEYLSQVFSVTRAAVWKWVKQLQEEGYVIESRSRQGYRLLSCPDIPYPQEIAPLLHTQRIGQKILYYPQVDSTNTQAMKICLEQPEDGLVLVASAQAKGRGRLEGEWSSPGHKGLYFSLVLTPPIPMAEMASLTGLAARSVSEALKSLYGLEAYFRLPGDVLVGEKKLCGILTEGLGELEALGMAAVGIGVNLLQEPGDFLPKQEESHASVKMLTGREDLSLCELLGELLNRMDESYLAFLRGMSI